MMGRAGDFTQTVDASKRWPRYGSDMQTSSAPDAFLSALAARDFNRLEQTISPTAQARMLLPRGPEFHAGRDDITQRIEGWFAMTTKFEVLHLNREEVGPRHRLNWRFRLSRDGESLEIVEQVAFVNVGAEGISDIDLICSGFLREDASTAGPVPA